MFETRAIIYFASHIVRPTQQNLRTTKGLSSKHAVNIKFENWNSFVNERTYRFNSFENTHFVCKSIESNRSNFTIEPVFFDSCIHTEQYIAIFIFSHSDCMNGWMGERLKTVCLPVHFPLMMRSSAINADKIKYCLLASENGCKKMKSGNQTEIPNWIRVRRLSKACCCFHLGTQWFWITNFARYYKNDFKKHCSSVQLMNSTKPRVNILPRSHGFWVLTP